MEMFRVRAILIVAAMVALIGANILALLALYLTFALSGGSTEIGLLLGAAFLCLIGLLVISEKVALPKARADWRTSS